MKDCPNKVLSISQDKDNNVEQSEDTTSKSPPATPRASKKDLEMGVAVLVKDDSNFKLVKIDMKNTPCIIEIRSETGLISSYENMPRSNAQPMQSDEESNGGDARSEEDDDDAYTTSDELDTDHRPTPTVDPEKANMSNIQAETMKVGCQGLPPKAKFSPINLGENKEIQEISQDILRMKNRRVPVDDESYDDRMSEDYSYNSQDYDTDDEAMEESWKGLRGWQTLVVFGFAVVFVRGLANGLSG